MARYLICWPATILAAVALLGWLLARGVISLWCVWAAVGSVVIDLEMRDAARQEARAAAAAPI